MEILSETKLSFEVINNLLHNESMWKKFNNIINKVKKGREVSIDELKFNMSAVFLATKFQSFQRPGAVYHFTIDEYNNGVFKSNEDGNGAKIFKVKEHKTFTTSGSEN